MSRIVADRNEAIKACKEDAGSGFIWRWRVVESARAKIPALLRSADPKDIAKGKSLRRRIAHLERYCEDAIKESEDAANDALEEARDPYAYRGLTRSMFH